MPPFAICSNQECSYGTDLKEQGRWEPHVLPVWCPCCNHRVIFHCPVCFGPLCRPPDVSKPECESCKTLLRPSVIESGSHLEILLISA
jgi:hypothetical protein